MTSETPNPKPSEDTEAHAKRFHKSAEDAEARSKRYAPAEPTEDVEAHLAGRGHEPAEDVEAHATKVRFGTEDANEDVEAHASDVKWSKGAAEDVEAHSAQAPISPADVEAHAKNRGTGPAEDVDAHAKNHGSEPAEDVEGHQIRTSRRRTTTSRRQSASSHTIRTTEARSGGPRCAAAAQFSAARKAAHLYRLSRPERAAQDPAGFDRAPWPRPDSRGSAGVVGSKRRRLAGDRVFGCVGSSVP